MEVSVGCACSAVHGDAAENLDDVEAFSRVPTDDMRLEALNHLEADAATRELHRCCGSSRWAAQMTAARPFATAEKMIEAADRIWLTLDPADWLEAFAAHPRIGDSLRSATSGGAPAPSEGPWSAQEQAGIADANADIRERLAQRNREYEARFGYIFIVCATGLGGGEMLAILESRLMNDPGTELRVAANEQRRITRLRLAKLLQPAQDTTT